MSVERRPYYVTKLLRTRDLHGPDVVLLPPVPNAWAEQRWMRWVDLTVEQRNHFRVLNDDLTLVEVQVRESPPVCLSCGHRAGSHSDNGHRTICMDPSGLCPCTGLVSDEA